MSWLIIILLCLVLVILVIRHVASGGIIRRYCGHIKTSLNGKTVVITGGNSGIGRETAIDLAHRGARVIIACRSEEKANVALKTIRTKSGSSNVVYRHLDLSDLDSVRSFAEKFLKDEDRLDILINNAGIGRSHEQTTKQGYDLTFGTNHLGHFLLTVLLLDCLKKSAPSRVVNVSSMAHLNVVNSNIDFSPGGDGKLKYPGLVGYDISKLANILFTRTLAQQLEENHFDVTAYSLHPGLIHTDIFYNSYQRGSPLLRYVLFTAAAFLCGINEKAGAQTTIYCAIEESITKYSGGYCNNCVFTQGSVSKLSKDDGLAKKLWDVSCKITGVDI